MYRTKWESKDKLPSVWYFLLLFVVQYCLIRHYKEISFNAICASYPSKTILPFLTSITGIAFWLRVGKLLTPVLIKSKIIQYIGENTWTVMMHHQFVFFLINTLIYFTLPITHIRTFDVQLFRENMWYGFGDYHFLLFYSIAGLAVPLLVQWVWEKKVINK